MRILLPVLLTLLASPASALFWEVDVIDGDCTLYSEQLGRAVYITHDPSIPLYTMTVTRDQPWPDTEVFGIAFTGGQELTITTDRQTFSGDRRSLIVTDTGFGNVFQGMATNEVANLFTDSIALLFPLGGAAEAIAAFEACHATPTA